jgi:hypothetical protein
MLALGCGKNLAGPGTDLLLQPPGGLYAYSADSTHVMLVWSASASASASDFAGYTASWGSVKDTVGATTFSYLAGPLPQGLMQFSVMSRRSDSFTGTPVTIAWAPAYRFDNGSLVIFEQDASRLGRAAGISLGNQTTPPSAQILDQTSQASIAFYLEGSGGQQLALHSGADFYAPWNVTMFSTVTTAAASLDTALAAFPVDATFTEHLVPVNDNVIYYARVSTSTSEVHYIRIHVNVSGGAYPDRSAVIRLSIQRVAGVPSAAAGIPERDVPCS